MLSAGLHAVHMRGKKYRMIPLLSHHNVVATLTYMNFRRVIGPIVLLNFMYGVAAYTVNAGRAPLGMIRAYFARYYETIPVPRPRAPGGEGSSGEQ